MTGTPARTEISDIQANSWSRSRMSLATEKTRWPALPSASPIATSSSAGGGGAGGQLAVLGPVQDGARVDAPMAPACTASRTMRGHLGDLLGGRGVVGPALAQHVGPQRAVGDEAGHVEHPVGPLHLVEVLPEGLPVPVHALGQRGAGDVLHALHELDQPFPVRVAGPARTRRRSSP